MAKIALELGVTGHMLFSTTHANSAIGTYDRFRQMDVPEYILPGITVSIGARLSKRLCQHCKQLVTSQEEISKLSFIFDSCFHDFDFGTLSPQDLCFITNDVNLKYLSTWEMKLAEIDQLNKEIRQLKNDNQDASHPEQKKLAHNRNLFETFKGFFLKNIYQRNPE